MQRGSSIRKKRKRDPDIWLFRWNVPVAQRETVVQPYALFHYFDWKSVTTILALNCTHRLSFSHP